MESMYGTGATFAGVPRAELAELPSPADVAAAVIGAPFDGGTSHRAGARFGPDAIRTTDYLPHDGRRPHLALGVDPLAELGVVDLGDVIMPAGRHRRVAGAAGAAVEAVAGAGIMPVVLGGDHTIALPDVTGVAAVGWGRVSVVHFDAHADTGDIQHGSLYGHGTPMRRLIESGAARGDRFLQIGLRGYWPEPETLAWMAGQRMRSYEMTEVVTTRPRQLPGRGLRHRHRRLRRRVPVGRHRCRRPRAGPGTGTPEPGGLTARQLLDAVRRVGMDLPLVGMDVVEVAPPYDHAEVTAYLANRVVLETLSGVAWRRRAPQSRRSPDRPLLEGRPPA